MVDIMARYLAVLNSSINFIIYCVADKKFRRIQGSFFHFRTDMPRINIEEVWYSLNLIHVNEIKVLKYFVESLEREKAMSQETFNRAI